MFSNFLGRVIFLLVSLSPPVLAVDLETKRTDDGIRYLSGGVGQMEAAAIRDAAKDYSLSLLFATEKGRYMAGVRTTIKKGNGTQVLTTVSDGPMLLVDLPPGRYSVEAAAEGKTFSQRVDIAKGQRRQVVLRWPAADN